MEIQPVVRKWRFMIILGVALVLLGFSATWAFAQVASGDGAINACVNTSDGGIRIVTDPASCKKNEQLLSWNITGPQGQEGPQGPQGDAGPTGAAGEQGPAGPQGPAGEPGLQGPQGVPGVDGQSAYAVAVDHGFVGTVEAWLASLIGPKGDTGEQGLQGPVGPVGPQGEQGLQGLKGDAGSSAYNVAVDNGFLGSVTDWLASLMGPQGPKGEPGDPGPQGPAGMTGPQGEAGPAGENGLACWDLNANGEKDLEEDLNGDWVFDTNDCKGEAGEAGPQGPTGATGPEGPQGDRGLQGLPGPQGPIGDTGATGAAGPQGPMGLTGAAGPQGPAGPQGEPGDPGSQGEQGLQGPAGPQGEQGLQGPAGPQGDTGPAGPQGTAGVSGYERIYTEDTAAVLQEKRVFAWCPYGKKPLGGGFNVVSHAVQVFENRPLTHWYSDYEGWAVYVYNSDWVFSHPVEVYVICADID